jgi:hypothetical protein
MQETPRRTCRSCHRPTGQADAGGAGTEVDRDAKLKVADAINYGVHPGALEDGRFMSIAQGALKLVGLELARNVRPEERAAFCVPVQVAVDGSTLHPGAVVLLEDRVIVAWSDVMPPSTPHAISCQIPDVSNVKVRTRDMTTLPWSRDALLFSVAGRAIELVLYSDVSEDRAGTLLCSALRGAGR